MIQYDRRFAPVACLMCAGDSVFNTPTPQDVVSLSSWIPLNSHIGAPFHYFVCPTVKQESVRSARPGAEIEGRERIQSVGFSGLMT